MASVAHATDACRILVVDDEPRLLSLVSRALLTRGYLVDVARDADSGLALARTGRYKLVILDLLMPGDLGGEEALRALSATRPDQRVLVLSSVADTSAKVRLLESGAADYLTKPFEIDELVARVSAQVRHAADIISGHDLRVGRVTLDRVRQTADAGNGPVHLSKREFLLLHCLMSNAGSPCKRNELLKEVWGYDFDPGTNAVDVYVRRLRVKLGANVIETVRGLGYLMHAP